MPMKSAVKSRVNIATSATFCTLPRKSGITVKRIASAERNEPAKLVKM